VVTENRNFQKKHMKASREEVEIKEGTQETGKEVKE
jgi:hypothetical protein